MHVLNTSGRSRSMAKMKLVESHSFAGCQFPGRKAISEIMTELERQKKARKDYCISSRNLTLKVIDKQMLLEIPVSGAEQLVPMSRGVYSRVAQDMGIRQVDRFYRCLTLGEQDGKGGKDHD